MQPIMKKVWETFDGVVEVSFGSEDEALAAVIRNFEGYVRADTEGSVNTLKLKHALIALRSAQEQVVKCLSHDEEV